jgi:antitoxin component of RelBE/YafQ-DinJ toxin-antitoxin module
MDTKVTLSFDKEVITRAKAYAQEHNMSLSRLIEFLLRKVTSQQHFSIEDYPVASWVHTLAEGPAEYKTKKRSTKKLKEAYYKAKKK